MIDGLDFRDFEIVPEPISATPYELLARVSPASDWSLMKDVSWDNARQMPGMMDLIMRVYELRSRPAILLRKKDI